MSGAAPWPESDLGPVNVQRMVAPDWELIVTCGSFFEAAAIPLNFGGSGASRSSLNGRLIFADSLPA